MDRLQLMSVFIAVAETRGFASAARKLGMSPPAVTRAVAALEKRLGVSLLHRTTRHVRVTEVGHRYLEDARRVVAEADTADAAVRGIDATPRGRISVTAPVMFGRIFVMPAVAEYLERFPQTEIRALLLDRDVNLLEEGIDFAVRIGELPDSEMRALAVGSVRQVVCAAPEYLKRSATPRRPEDLSAHTIIESIAANNLPGWRFGAAGGSRSLRVKPRLTVNTNDSAIEAALGGLGITRLLSYQVAHEVASGRLQILLEDFEPEPRPVHIVHREGRLASPTIRNCIDFIAERLRADRHIN